MKGDYRPKNGQKLPLLSKAKHKMPYRDKKNVTSRNKEATMNQYIKLPLHTEPCMRL